VTLIFCFTGCDNFDQDVQFLVRLRFERELSTEPFELPQPVRCNLFPVLDFSRLQASAFIEVP